MFTNYRRDFSFLKNLQQDASIYALYLVYQNRLHIYFLLTKRMNQSVLMTVLRDKKRKKISRVLIKFGACCQTTISRVGNSCLHFSKSMLAVLHQISYKRTAVIVFPKI